MQAPRGTGAYGAIYRIVAAIPSGRVATYGQVAVLAGLPGHARQVGYALHALPADLDLPWQRVLNAKGEVSLRSPESGPGREGYQRHLLEEEGVEFDLAGRVDLKRFCWDPDDVIAPALGSRQRGRGARNGGTPPGQVEQWRREIEARLSLLGNPERARSAKAYLKSDLEFWGLDTPKLRQEARAFWKEHGAPDREELAALVEDLWRRPVHELRAFAIETLLLYTSLLEADDLSRIEGLLRRSNSWAYVDVLAVHVAGPLIDRHTRLRRTLDRWARDGDFWLRRSALLALLLPIRRGAGDWERWTRYADAMLEETEFFLRKAIGWVLREAGKRRPERVRDYVASRLDRLSGLTLREAVKVLPDEERSRLLASHAALRRARRRESPPARRASIERRRRMR